MELLYNGTIINDGHTMKGYLAMDHGVITEVAPGIPSAQLMQAAGDSAADVAGAMILPGVIDEHVHFRDPGLTQKADIETESSAAVAGGVTSYMDMPNVVPPTVTLDRLEAKMECAARLSHANYSFYIGATDDNCDDVLRHVDFRHVCGIKAFLGKSTGGMLLSDPEAMRRVMGIEGPIVAIHSEDEDVIARNRAHYVAQYGTTDLPLSCHPLIRSAEACLVSTRMAVDLARRLGTRLHIMHVSTEAELALLDGGTCLCDKRITAEAVIAHLLFTDADYARLGNRIKCNPAVKTAADRAALRAAVKNGLIDTIGTDHAPHLLADKQGGCLKAASGMPMVQFSLVAMLELARQGVLSVVQVVQRMCHAPADLYRIDRRGYLRRGYHADVTVVSCLDEPHIITDADVVSKCAWTPLAGMPVHHRVERTYVGGRLAYDRLNGGVDSSVLGSALEFNV